MTKEVRYTWLPWRRKYRPIPQPDGGTLRRVPPESPNRRWDTWAREEWARYERRQWCVMGGGCPGCYYGREAELDEALAAGRGAEYGFPPIDAAARRRWRDHAVINRLKDAALGGCRCGGGTGPLVLHPGESWTVNVEIDPESGVGL